MRPHHGLFALACALFSTALLHDLWDGWIARTALPPVLAETSVEVVARDGTLLRAFDVENGRLRLAVALERVDPDFVDMLLAYEDKRFWHHNGVDGLAMARAIGQALWHGQVVSGGSTLTMQVARLLENGPTGSLRGKWRQMRVAWALERRLSKTAILQLYLQHAPYGGRIEGVRSAALIWFGKEPRRLTQAEAALLVALPQAPEGRRPDRHPETAQRARNRVLARLGGTASTATVPGAMRPVPQLAPHLGDALRRADPLTTRFDTTLDATLQKQVTQLAQTHVAAMGQGVSAAVIVADHQNGEILARLGSPHYADNRGTPGFVDMTQATRSPGSTLKPLIYALAFDRGLAHPETILPDRPTHFGRYAPQNFDGAFRGDIAAREALQLSLNVPVVALTDALTPERVMGALRGFGTQPTLPSDAAPGLAIALGGLGMSLQDLTQLYGGLAQGGGARPLFSLQGTRPAGAQTLAQRAAWQVGDILSGIPAPAGARGGLAYKTGTSYGHRDAWAIGYDGHHVVGVWLGRPDGTPVPGAFGGDHAAPLLFEVFGRIKSYYTPLPPAPPDTLTVARSDLPARLQRFGGAQDANAPRMIFPPNGAILTTSETAVKLRGGTLPLTVLLNGAPLPRKMKRRNFALDNLGQGYSDIAVIDANGRSARVTIQTMP